MQIIHANTTVRELLTGAGVAFRVNPRLVRGLDYYNLTVFEWISDSLGAQGTLCGGGRYDGLAEEQACTYACSGLTAFSALKKAAPLVKGDTLLIIGALVISTVLWADLANRYVLMVLLVVIWLGIVGFMDDYLKFLKNISNRNIKNPEPFLRVWFTGWTVL